MLFLDHAAIEWLICLLKASDYLIFKESRINSLEGTRNVITMQFKYRNLVNANRFLGHCHL